MAKQKGFFIKLDEDFSSDPKIRKLRRMAGRIAVLDYIELLPVFNRYDGFCIPFDDLADIAECDLFVKEKDLRKSVDACIETGLFVSDGESFWSARRKSDLQMRVRMQKARSDAGKAGMKSRWDKGKGVSGVIQDDSKAITGVKHELYQDDNKSIAPDTGCYNNSITDIDKDIDEERRDSLSRESSSPRKKPSLLSQTTGNIQNPSLEDVTAYFRANCLKGNPADFFACYAPVGWIDAAGRKIIDWHAMALKWASRENAKPMASPQKPRDYDGSYDGCRMEEVTI